MNETRAQRIRRIFDDATERDPSDRAAFVEAACEGDGALRQEVLALLDAWDDSGDFLESGPSPTMLREALPPEASESLVGTTLGAYRVTGILARGGMGVVYRAEQENPKRAVALKVMAPEVARPDLAKRFELETRVLARLKHPGIAQIYEAGTAEADGGVRPYFAMELVEGPTIRDYAEENGLDAAARVSLTIRVCDAVQHAHQKGVIHRDLKPENVLVDASGQPKVLDFGIARATEDDLHPATARTTQGEILGTLAYMSPEQVRGDLDEIDTRTDVYSLGVVLYELLSGERPHAIAGRSLPDAIRVVASEEPRRLPAVRGIGGDLRVIVAKALATERERRYASPSELAEDLRRYLAGEPVLARPASALYQLRKLVGRNRLASGLAAGLLVALLAAGTVLVFQNRAIREAGDRARREAASANEVSEFLVGMFRNADPSESKGSAVTARELLDRGAERIDRELDGQPVVRRRLQRTMGEAYTELGFPERAIPLLERAVEGSGEAEHHERVVLLARLAWAHQKSGNDDGAFEIARRAVEVAGEDDPVENESDAVALQALGRLLVERRQYARGREIFERCLEIRERILGPDHKDVAIALHSLGWTLLFTGASEEAERAYARACPIYEKEFGADHAWTAACLSNHGLVLADLDRHDEAEAQMQRGLEIRQSILPKGHPDLVASWSSLAVIRERAGDLVGSRRLFDESFRMAVESLGSEHPYTKSVRSGLARVEERLGGYDESERLRREAVEIGERLASTSRPDHASALTDLGFFLLRRGRIEEGERHVRRALDLLAESPGRESRVYARQLESLATALEGLPDREDEARALRAESVAILASLEPGDPTGVAPQPAPDSAP